MSTVPDISVILCTYNQEKYIREAVQSILRQEDCPVYEIIVADDGSTDRTLEIIRYELRNCKSVTFLPSDINRGISKNYKRAFQACRGRYVAVLEGDDFWCSPVKLASQYKLLERHWECSLATGRTCIQFEQLGRNVILPDIKQQSTLTYFSVENLIQHNFTNFSGVMYRQKLLKNIPDKYFQIGAYDWLLNIWMAQFGLIGCVPEVQTVYRVHDGGLWSGLSQENKLRAQLDALASYNAFLDFRYRKEFRRLKRRLEAEIGRLSSNSKGAKGIVIRSLRRLYRSSPKTLVRVARDVLPASIRHKVIRALVMGK